MGEFTRDEWDDKVFPDEADMADDEVLRKARERIDGGKKLEGARQPDGAIHFNGKTPFILSNEPWRTPQKPSKDVILVTYDPAWSEMRTGALGRKVFYFQVYNETKGHSYSTELFEGIRGEPCANCNCPAAVVCKHIINCLVKVLVDLDPEFGAAEKDSEFMFFAATGSPSS